MKEFNLMGLQSLWKRLKILLAIHGLHPGGPPWPSTFHA